MLRVVLCMGTTRENDDFRAGRFLAAEKIEDLEGVGTNGVVARQAIALARRANPYDAVCQHRGYERHGEPTGRAGEAPEHGVRAHRVQHARTEGRYR